MIGSPLASPPAALSASDFKVIADILRSESRVSLSEAKINLVQSRLGRRMRGCGVGDVGEYIALVRRDKGERAAMVDALTTNHTHFFREKHHFDHLEREVLPELKAHAAEGRPVRLWSAGCSSGEEAYSLAMTLAGTSQKEASWLSDKVRVLATDLSTPMVAATEAATYSSLAAEQIPLPYRASWLSERDGSITVAPVLRALVTVRQLNLFGEWPFAKRFDVIFCRNVMIYFDAEARAELEQRLVDQLRPGGWLYIGHSERLSGAAAEATSCRGQTIYRKKGAA